MQIVRFSVAAGASVNANENFMTRTPLHFALQLQYPPTELIQRLLVQVDDPNVSGWIGCTPFLVLPSLDSL